MKLLADIVSFCSWTANFAFVFLTLTYPDLSSDPVPPNFASVFLVLTYPDLNNETPPQYCLHLQLDRQFCFHLSHTHLSRLEQ